MDEAFGTGEEAFAEEDWQHALGGLHAVLVDGEAVIAHASVVERELWIAGRPVRTGYVEAVATRPGLEGRGHGSRVMEAVGEHIRATFELGALGTGRHSFYQRLGWETWQGPLFVRAAGTGDEGPSLERTPDDEGSLLVLRTPASPPFEGTEPLSCDWRPGDVW
jgi:aminoglycoside 2'-N-acetyltransferase I